MDLKKQKELNDENEKLKKQLAEMEAKLSQLSHSDLQEDLPRKKVTRSTDLSDEVPQVHVNASHFDLLVNNFTGSKPIPSKEIDMIQ